MKREVRAFTFAEKALARGAGLAEACAGELLEVRPDRILSHDNTSAIARIFYEQIGQRRVADPEQLCITLDHASPPPTPKHAQNHAEARAFVREQGVRNFFEVGRGICHQVLSEEALVLPGQIILGADSHTTHYGWLGAFGAGLGRSEVAVLWATGSLWLRVPYSIRFTLNGSLPPGVTAKDLSLSIIGQLGADGGLYASVEFAGPGLSGLSLESRMVIPNMMAEFGVKNAYLAPDEAVFAYLEERLAARDPFIPAARLLREQALYPDEGANYTAEYTLQLDQLEPLIACPHTVDNVQPLSLVAGRKIDLAFIGTCTNGRLEDLAAAAEVLLGRQVHAGTRLLIIPASSQVYRQALQAGYLETFLEAGAAIGTPGCGPCMGNHLGIPAAGEVVISSANRNFRGRMGQPEAEIYLASPAVVAASAVLGRIAHPAELMGHGLVRMARINVDVFDKTETNETGGSQTRPGLKPPGYGDQNRLTAPDESGFSLDQGHSDGRKDGESPVHGSLSHRPAVQRRAGTGVGHPHGKAWKYGDNINTDQIFPGKYTYTLSAPQEIAAHALEDLDPAFAKAVRAGDVIFGGRNFGCGSSREQAAACLKASGVSAIVAESFGRIFYRNAINQGLPAVVCPQAVAAAGPGDTVQIDLKQALIHLPAGTFAFPPFPANIQGILKAGGLIQSIKSLPRKTLG